MLRIITRFSDDIGCWCPLRVPARDRPVQRMRCYLAIYFAPSSSTFALPKYLRTPIVK